MTTAAVDVIVVGLGAMGSAAAYELARRGQRVLGLDAFAPGHTLGSSHGETRIIRMAYFEHPSYVPLLRRAYTLWDHLQREAGSQLLRITGGIFLGEPTSDLVRGSRRSAEAHGLPHEVLEADAIRARFPVLEARPQEVGVYEEQAGVLFPERCIETYQRLAAAHGARLRHNEPVRAWSIQHGEVRVTTDRGSVTAGRLVLCAGAWLGRLLADLRLPLQPERIPLFWFEPARAAAHFELGQFPICMWDDAGTGVFYLTPHVAWPGVKLGKHHSRVACDPDTVDRGISAVDEAPLRAFLARCLPALDGRVAASRVCLYTNTPDEHFVIDRHPAHPEVVFAGGFSGHGFKFASVVGEILAELALHGQATADAAFLRLSRRSLQGA